MPPRFDNTEAIDAFRRFNRRVGARIRDARLDNSMTQDELGLMIQRPKTWVSACESGRNGVNSMDLVKISEATHRPIAYFFSDGAITEPQFMQPVTLADWLALYPGDHDRANGHFQLDKIFVKSEQVARARERVRA